MPTPKPTPSPTFCAVLLTGPDVGLPEESEDDVPDDWELAVMVAAVAVLVLLELVVDELEPGVLVVETGWSVMLK